jgi:hypothetical protein
VVTYDNVIKLTCIQQKAAATAICEKRNATKDLHAVQLAGIRDWNATFNQYCGITTNNEQEACSQG